MKVRKKVNYRRNRNYFGSVDQGSYQYSNNPGYDEVPQYSENFDEGPKEKESSSGGLLNAVGEASGMCTQSGVCGSASERAAQTASKALGPPMQPIGQNVLAGYANDKSPAGQAQYEAALEYNMEVERQNKERQALIAQYMKEMTSPITQQDLALGDAARAEYAKLIAKYGEDTKYLTLTQVYEKYPNEAGAILQTLARVVPGLQGKSVEQVWASLPEVFKSLTLMDLQGAFPNSSWLNPNSPAQVGLSSTSSLTPILLLGAGLAVGAMFLLAGKRKQNV